MKLIKNIKRFIRKRANRQRTDCLFASEMHSQRLLYLQQQLDKAIAEGEYETAAVISDELQWLMRE
jgi:protein-arginine kinase activator protein McsA